MRPRVTATAAPICAQGAAWQVTHRGPFVNSTELQHPRTTSFGFQQPQESLSSWTSSFGFQQQTPSAKHCTKHREGREIEHNCLARQTYRLPASKLGQLPLRSKILLLQLRAWCETLFHNEFHNELPCVYDQFEWVQ
eukprot:1161239-Pelagomonas_calceolata.AAC.7